VCGPSSKDSHTGGNSLEINVDLAADSWATCALFFDDLQDWSGADGLSFYLRAENPIPLELNLYLGGAEEQESYQHPLSTADETWSAYQIEWTDLQRVQWEENAGTPLSVPNRIVGIAFGFSEEGGSSGVVWIDDLQLSHSEPTTPERQTDEDLSLEDESSGLPICGGIITPFVIGGWVFVGAGILRSRRKLGMI
jgi:hypothetical protein